MRLTNGTRNARRMLPLMWTALIIPACMSVPDSTFHTLDMSSSGSISESGVVDVDRLYAVDALNRPGIMILAAPTRVEYYATDEWVSDLAQLVREKLQNEFGAVLTPKYRVRGDILRFEQIDTDTGADARVKIKVTAFAADEGRSTDAILQKTYEAQVAAAGREADSVVAALSKAVEEIAVQIGNDLSTL